jgi:hypothetical protein
MTRAMLNVIFLTAMATARIHNGRESCFNGDIHCGDGGNSDCWLVGWLTESLYSYASGDIYKDGASTPYR